MSGNTLLIAGIHRLHDAAAALPAPTGSPTAEELKLSGDGIGARDAVLQFSGPASALTAPVVLWAWLSYTTTTGPNPGTTVALWSPVDVILDAGSLVVPTTYNFRKLSPAFKALRVQAAGVVGADVSVDVLREASPR